MIEEEIGLDRYFAAVWRAKWLVLVGVISAAAVMAAIEYNRPTLHSATAVIRVGQVWKEPLQDLYVTTEIANNDGFLQAVATRVGTDSASLRRHLHAETITGGPARAPYALLLRFTAIAENGDESLKIAEAAADEILARHEKLFDEALAPRLMHQQRLEELIRQMQAYAKGKAPSETGSIDLEMYPRQVSKAMADGQLLLMVRLMREFSDAKTSNSSPTETHKTALVDAVVPGSITKPAIGRDTLVTGLVAALIYVAAALAFEYFSKMVFRKRSDIVAHVAASARSQPDATGS
jgi:cytochrome c553